MLLQILAIAAVVFFAFAVLDWTSGLAIKWRPSFRYLRTVAERHYGWLIAGIAALFVLATGFLGNVAWEIVTKEPSKELWLMFAFLLCLSGLLAYLASVTFIEVLETAGEGVLLDKPRVDLLVLPVSLLKETAASAHDYDTSYAIGLEKVLRDTQGAPGSSFYSQVFEETNARRTVGGAPLNAQGASPDPIDFPWFPSLASLEKHLTARPLQLKKVIVLPSPQTEGQAPIFKLLVDAIIDKLAPPNSRILCEIEPAQDYQSFKDVQEELRKLIERERAKPGGDRARICIDITGGQKTFSAAGAVAALRRGVLFSYVSDRSPDDRTKLDFDVIFYEIWMRRTESLKG